VFGVKRKYWIGRLCLPSFYRVGLTNDCRVVETLPENIFWLSSKHGKREDNFPGIRKIQRAFMPLLRSSFYARSEVVAFRKRNGSSDKVRVVVTS
jgi:hypothetical protein